MFYYRAKVLNELERQRVIQLVASIGGKVNESGADNPIVRFEVPNLGASRDLRNLLGERMWIEAGGVAAIRD